MLSTGCSFLYIHYPFLTCLPIYFHVLGPLTKFGWRYRWVYNVLTWICKTDGHSGSFGMYVLRQTTLLGLTKRQGDFTGMHTHAYVFLAQWTSRLLIWTVLNTPGSCGLLISSCCFKFPSPPPRILSPPHSDMQIIALLLSSLSAIFVFRRLWAWWEAVRAIR